MNLETNNLILKEYTMNNLIDYYTLKSNQEVWKYSTIEVINSIEDARLNLKKHIVNYKSTAFLHHGIFLKTSSMFIGEAGILSYNPNVDRCSIGYNLLPAYWNKGYATEIVRGLVNYGFTTLNCERVEALAVKDNIASRRVLEKNGFVLEGVLRHFTKINGTYKDVCYYATLLSD